MRRIEWSELSKAERAAALARPARRSDADVAAFVRRLFDEVAEEGAAAVERWALKLDGRAPAAVEISPKRLAEARAALSGAALAAIERAIDQVRFYHEATKPAAKTIAPCAGLRLERRWRAIPACGLYAPGGAAPLVSTLIMLAEPARAAGVAERIVVTPPGRDGELQPAMIAAAGAAGIERIWLLGGAQAIAALAFGAVTPKADKIFGPGNAYVAEAKRYAASLPGGPAIDLPAGPSELMLIADRAANAAFIAADLLSQAEHDADAQVLLVSTSGELIEAVEAELKAQLASLPRQEILVGALAEARFIRVRDLGEAAEIANAYAPEHLSLQVAAPEALLDFIAAAGAIFVGGYSAETFGDYVAGPSHVLPTDGAARAFGGVSVASFMTSFTVQTLDAAAVRTLAGPAAALARLEGLEAHARAADLRAADAARESASEAAEVVRRRGQVERATRETRVRAVVDLDRAKPVAISTGVGFFDHMLEQVAQHGGFSLELMCEGDLHVDAHHTIEDCALALGAALKQALGARRGIGRYGFVLPMDEAEAKVSLDLGGRPYLVFDAAFAAPMLGEYPTEMTEHVFRSLAQNLGAAVHVAVSGENDHHKTEACFKALGRALRQAVRMEDGELPSTKGLIE